MQSEAALYSTKKGHPTMQPQPHGPCGECDLMWSDYGHLTAEHLNLLLERDMATARADWEVEDHLNSQIPVAESRRGECRERIRKHEGEDHNARQDRAA